MPPFPNPHSLDDREPTWAEVAAARLTDLYDPMQPRVPAGSPAGGQWTSGTSVGITSSRPGKPSKQVFEEMRAFERDLTALPGVRDVQVRPGLGAWEGGEEPTWVVRYTGNGEATKLLARTAKRYDQDAVLLMKPCRGATCDPVVDFRFDRPISKSAMTALTPILTAAGLGGWTWGKQGGQTVLRAASVPAWGGERAAHLAKTRRLSADLAKAGLTHARTVRDVRAEVLDRSTYDQVEE